MVEQTQSYNLTINDTSPIWFYCTAIDSCTPNGEYNSAISLVKLLGNLTILLLRNGRSYKSIEWKFY